MNPRRGLPPVPDSDEFGGQGQRPFDKDDPKPSGRHQARYFLDWSIRALFFPAIGFLWLTIHNLDKDVSYIRGQIDVIRENTVGQGSATDPTRVHGKVENEILLVELLPDHVQGPPKRNLPRH